MDRTRRTTTQHCFIYFYFLFLFIFLALTLLKLIDCFPSAVVSISPYLYVYARARTRMCMCVCMRVYKAEKNSFLWGGGGKNERRMVFWFEFWARKSRKRFVRVIFLFFFRSLSISYFAGGTEIRLLFKKKKNFGTHISCTSRTRVCYKLCTWCKAYNIRSRSRTSHAVVSARRWSNTYESQLLAGAHSRNLILGWGLIFQNKISNTF